MSLDFDLNNVNTTEFGVGRDNNGEQTFRIVAVDANVQLALREMVIATWGAMKSSSIIPPIYEPSEKYESQKYVHLPLGSNLAEHMRSLHQAENLDIGDVANPNELFCYFARLTDKQGLRLTAVRRATQFKGILKSRLLQFVTDALAIVEDSVFKLDSDFDMVIDANTVHILRPSGFEFVGKLRNAILEAASGNCQAIANSLPFVEFAGIEKYAKVHPRAARYLASINSLGEMQNISRGALEELCTKTGVCFGEDNGKLFVDEKNVMGFLEVLDRRRYGVELVEGSPEQYRAPSRKKIGN